MKLKRSFQRLSVPQLHSKLVAAVALVCSCYILCGSLLVLVGFYTAVHLLGAFAAWAVFSFFFYFVSSQTQFRHVSKNIRLTVFVVGLLGITALIGWTYIHPQLVLNQKYPVLAQYYLKENEWTTLHPVKRVVASLSTTPNNIKNIGPTLESLLLQKYPLDAIYLNLPKFSKRLNKPYPEYDCPYPNVTVVDTEDYGPLTKLLPALFQEDDPDTIVITVDDDRSYHPELVSNLVFHMLQNPESAVAGAGWAIMRPAWPIGFGAIYPPTENLINHQEGYVVDILEGYSGAAYRRGFFDTTLLQNVPDPCFTIDDVYISGYLATKTHTKKVVIKNHYPYKTEITLKEDHERLHHFNGSRKRMFLECIEALEAIYGPWDPIN